MNRRTFFQTIAALGAAWLAPKLPGAKANNGGGLIVPPEYKISIPAEMVSRLGQMRITAELIEDARVGNLRSTWTE